MELLTGEATFPAGERWRQPSRRRAQFMTNRKRTRRTAVKAVSANRPARLLAEVRELILSARVQVAQAVNAGLTMLYWHIGNCVRHDILKNKRAGYGAE